MENNHPRFRLFYTQAQCLLSFKKAEGVSHAVN